MKRSKKSFFASGWASEMATRRLAAAALVAVNFAVGCLPDVDSDAGTPLDAGLLFDAGRPLDAGVLTDGGLHPDAGVDAGAPTLDAGPPYDVECREDGCVRAVQAIGDYNRATIVAQVPAEVVVDNGYTVYWIRFVTRGREARAVMTVPLPGEVTPPSDGFHVVVNAPGTVGLGDDCALAFGVAGAGLAGTFGARGLVGVSLDYPGIGTEGPHPYLVSTSEGDAVLHAASAALKVLRVLQVPTSERVALVGLSQGGHAVLSAAKRFDEVEPSVDVRAVAAAGPATCFLENWAQSVAVAGDHIAYHALLTRAWEVEYGHQGPALWNDAGLDVVERLDTRCLIAPSGVALGDPMAEGGVGEDPSSIFSADYVAAFASGDSAVLVDAGYAFLAEGFAANRVDAFAQTVPIKIFQGTDDDVVLASRIQAAVNGWNAAGMEVELDLVEGGGHTDVAFSFLAVPQLRTEDALAWLLAHLDASD